MFTRLSLTWECLLTPFKTLSVLQVHFFEKRSKTDPKTSEPLPTSDVPKVPDFQPQILGVPKAAEVDDNTPTYVYPWMPSISAARKKDAEMKRAREQEARKAWSENTPFNLL